MFIKVQQNRQIYIEPNLKQGIGYVHVMVDFIFMV